MTEKRRRPALRHMDNPADDYATYMRHAAQKGLGSSVDELKFTGTAEYERLCRELREQLKEDVARVEKAYPPSSSLAPGSVRERSDRDFSIYIGAGGNAYLHWKLAKFFQAESNPGKAEEHGQKAVQAIAVAISLLRKPSSNSIAFYIGNAGTHALAAAIYWRIGDRSKAQVQLQLLLALLPHSLHSAAADELLYGRAGYLYSLLFVRKNVGQELVASCGLDSVMRKVFDAIMESGKKTARSTGSRGIQFHFYGVDYLGAAHGTAGILYILLQFPEWCCEPANEPLIKLSLSKLLSHQFPSGNFPAAADSRTDEVLHWCHGAPGATYTLYQAHKVYRDPAYKQALERALRSVWDRGVIKKGSGVCHGTSGNAYAFLQMYRYRGNDEYYYCAMKMAEVMETEDVKKEVSATWDPQRYRAGVPDFPFSLMEGLGGTVCFKCDLLHPELSAFPGYDGDI